MKVMKNVVLMLKEGDLIMYQFKIALSFATEDQKLVDKVYHYLKAEGINAFFAPSSEGQIFLSGKNQREAFYEIFGISSEYIALFVSKYYIARDVPMEEAGIAFAKHAQEGSVIPIYLDGTELPRDLFDPKDTNYFKSNNPAIIANHLASKIKLQETVYHNTEVAKGTNTMNVKGNIADRQVFIQTMNGSMEL